jgi:precorrin-2 dehydrogenase/sirohydrochlorin ferrochelatase
MIVGLEEEAIGNMSHQAGFQLTVDLEGRSCLVLGGDDEALEKVRRLVDAGARVTVVHPTLHAELRKLTASAKIIHRGRTFRSTDSQGVTLVLNVLKDDLGLAKSLYELAQPERFLLWSIDRPDFSTVMMPALVQRGALRIAISTSGTSPALAGVIRRSLESLFDEEFEQFLDWLGALREELKKTELSDHRRRERLLEAIDGFKLTGEITYPGSWKLSGESQLESVGKDGG